MAIKIGLAWDLGAGRGHAVRLATLARHVRESGHEPVLFARNLRTMRAVLDVPARLLPAPHNDWIPRDAAPASWGDILWSECGLHDETHAVAIALAWRDMLAMSEVEALLVDAAPLAHPAARSLGLRSVAIGTGFLVPPSGPPWPLFRTWEPDDDARRAQRDALLRQRVDALHRALDLPPQASLADGDAHALFTFAAFDHYVGRNAVTYLGPMLGRGEIPHWPQGERRVFLYLQPSYPHLAALHAALQQRTDLAVLAYFGGAQAWAESSRLRIATQALDMRAVLAQAEIVIAHGGNLAVAAAVHGLPTLLLPVQAETYITAKRIEARGAALSVTPPLDPLDFDTPLQRLRDDPQFAASAQRIAAECVLRDDVDIAREVLGLLGP